MKVEEIIKRLKVQTIKNNLEKRGIQRYSILDGVLVENDGGDIVKFLDHAIEIGKLKQRATEAYNEGKQIGPEYSWRL